MQSPKTSWADIQNILTNTSQKNHQGVKDDIQRTQRQVEFKTIRGYHGGVCAIWNACVERNTPR